MFNLQIIFLWQTYSNNKIKILNKYLEFNKLTTKDFRMKTEMILEYKIFREVII
jgi:hypothetical protein